METLSCLTDGTCILAFLVVPEASRSGHPATRLSPEELAFTIMTSCTKRRPSPPPHLQRFRKYPKCYHRTPRTAFVPGPNTTLCHLVLPLHYQSGRRNDVAEVVSYCVKIRKGSGRTRDKSSKWMEGHLDQTLWRKKRPASRRSLCTSGPRHGARRVPHFES